LALARRVEKARASEKPQETESEPASPGADEKPGPSIEIEALRLGHVHLRWHDASIRPELDARLDFDLSLADLHVSQKGNRPTRLEITASCPPVAESLRIEGSALSSGQNTTLELEVALDHVHMESLAGYLERLGLRAAARDLSVGVKLRALTHPAIDGSGGTGGTLALERLRATADGEEVLALDRLLVDAIGISRENVDIASVGLDGLRASAVRLEDGSLRVAGVDLRPGPRAGAPASDVVSSPGKKGDDAPARFSLGDFAARNVRASFLDRKTSPHAALSASLDLLHVQDVLRDARSPGAPARVEARLSAPGIAEDIALLGSATPFGPRTAADLSLAVSGITLRALVPYLEPAGVTPLFSRGSLKARLHASATRAADGKDELEAAVRDLVLDDGDELAGIDLVRASGVRLDPDLARFHVEEAEVDLPRFHARRDAQGALVGLGFRVRPRGSEHVSPDPGTNPEESVAARAGPPLHASLGRLTIDDGVLGWDDETTKEPVSLVLTGIGLEVAALDVVLDPKAPPPSPAKLDARFNAHDVARVRLRGELVASATRPSFSLGLQATEITGSAIAPYLEGARIRSLLHEGRLEVVLSASAKVERDGPLEADLAVERIRLLDRAPEEREVFSLAGLRAKRARLGPDPRRVEQIEVGLLELERIHAHAAARPDALELLGLSLLRASEMAPVASSTPGARETSAGPGLPLIKVEKLRVGEAALDLRDALSEPAIDIPIRAKVELGPITIDPTGNRAGDEAPFALALAVPGALEKLSLAGTVAPSPRRSELRATLEASGITLGILAPRLRARGIEPLLRSGSLRFELSSTATVDRDDIESDTTIEQLVLEDEGEELLGIDSARAKGFHLLPGRYAFEDVRVARPRAKLERTKEGALVALGLRFSPVPRGASATSTSEKPAAEEPPFWTEGKPTYELYKVAVTDATADFHDGAVRGEARFQASASVLLEDFVLGIRSPSATVKAELKVPGALEALTVAGRITFNPRWRGCELDIDVDGLRPGPLSPYFRDGTRLLLKDGRAHALVRARFMDNPAGGSTGRGEITEVALRDGPRGASIFSFDRLRFFASRLDPSGGVFTFDDLLLSGLETEIERDEQGALRLLGLAFPEKKVEAAEAGAGGEPKEPPEKARRTPLIDIWKLDANARSVVFRDLAKKDAAPLAFKGVRLRNTKLLSLLGPDPASRPPLELELSLGVAPIVSQAVIAGRLAPFAQEPSFSLDIALEGVRGAGLTEVAPGLAASLDGSRLTDGRLRARLDIDLRTRRRDPLDWDLSRGFGLDLALKGLQVRNGSGPLLFGIDELLLDVARFDPKTGSAHVRSLEVAKPAASLVDEPGGLRFLDVVWKRERRDEKEEKEDDAADETPSPGAAPEKKPARELRLDRVLISEVDFVYEDSTCAPRLIVPVADIDLELAGLLVADGDLRAIRFAGVAKAGKVRLVKREKKRFGHAIVSKITSMWQDKALLEDRPLFLELAAKGDLQLRPRPLGHVRLDLQTLELAAFKGLAKEKNIVLEGGTADLELDLAFETRGLLSRAVVTFADLEVSEPRGGWLAKHFLPGVDAPLSVVQFVLRDAEGNITLVLNPPPLQGRSVKKLVKRAIWEAFPEALARLVGDAIKNPAFRLLGTAKDLGMEALELLGADDIFGKKAEEIEPASVSFPAGDPRAAQAEIAKVLELAGKVTERGEVVLTLRHETGSADLARARLVASPQAADRRDLIARLSSSRADLEARVDDARASARALLVSEGDEGARSASSRLRALESELARVDHALDSVYGREREGASHQAERRERAASLELARARLASVRAALVAQGFPDPDERIRVPSPRVDSSPSAREGSVTIVATLKPRR
ncbi:DUF748 domain-containing protein, partial [bacterium]|nr:DUF748 domain-containing protein [bacterium]